MLEGGNADQQPVPLLVDVDGSLIRTDTLFETLLLVLKASPWLIFMMPFWLLKSRQFLKEQLAKRSSLKVALLPYRADVISYLEDQFTTHKRKIILCTGSWHQIADDIGALYPWVDSVVATTADKNLTGKNKAQWAVNTFGERGFDYLGNEEKDLALWKVSRHALVVGSDKLAKKAAKVTVVEKKFPVAVASFKVWLKAIRIHQWAKNALVFVPIIVAHELSVNNFLQVTLAFFSLGLCASATYLLNDMFDLEADRQHRVKSNRPLAAGLISIPAGVLAGTLLMVSGLLVALTINVYFVASLLIYLLLTVLYSFRLKKLQTIDVIVLACLFTIRVIAGGMAIGVQPSFWLLCFSMFIFLSLALVKRVAELIRVEQFSSDAKVLKGRGYYSADIVILQSLGGASGFLAVFVFALYINSPEVASMYHLPELLWLMCPVLGYWVMRIWMLTARNQMNEDPISFAVTDRNSWLAFLLMGGVMALAIML